MTRAVPTSTRAPSRAPAGPAPAGPARCAGSRAGFTFVEALTVLVLLGVLVAVTVPVVVQLTRIAETARLVRDIENLRIAVQQFNLHTRTLPRYVVHLAGPIATNDSTAYETFYSAAQVRRWRGPYVDLDLDPEMRDEETADAWETGYDGRIYNALYCYDPAIGFAFFNCPRGAHLAVRVDGLTGEQFARINTIIDGPSEPTGLNTNSVPASWEMGQLRFVLSNGIDINSSIGILFYLVQPSREGI